MNLVSLVSDLLWNNVLIFLLILGGIWFTVKLSFIQVVNFRHMFTLVKPTEKATRTGISPFQALMTSLAARVGTGNLAGVAIAISLGGPGAIFWMWLIALLGMATGYAESLLGQLYKVKDANGEYRGGPAYYIRLGLKLPRLASFFSLLIFIGYGFVFSSVQANTIAEAVNNSLGVSNNITGIFIVLIAGIILIGGMKSIANSVSVLVPIMGISYLVVALSICAINFDQLPNIILLIVKSAFGLEEATSGLLGAAIINGIKRGLYSNEAGAGTVPHAAACASPNPRHPATQGFVQMFGVFLDTIVVCTATAMIILLAGTPDEGVTGIRLTQFALEFHFGAYGRDYILVAICLFSFTSIVANFVYAESNLHLIRFDNPLRKQIFILLFLYMTFWGATSSLPEVWKLADLSLGLTTLINISVLLLLTPTIIAVTQDYKRQIKLCKIPQFTEKDKSDLVQGRLGKGIW